MRSLKDKFAYAFVGLKKGVLEDRSVKLQCFIAALVILFCLFLPLARWEWGIVLLLCTLVIALEFVNSVIEKCVDLICPHYDERVKTIKDLMAGAVLFVSLAAAGIFVIILGGKII